MWTKNAGSGAFGYIGRLCKYLQLHTEESANDNCLIIGDFNSNAIWDKSDRRWNHSDVIEQFNAISLESVYHSRTGDKQGKEQTPSFYLYRYIHRTYHIDYVFLARNLLPRCCLNIGKAEDWLSLSDHMPLILDIAE